MACTQTTNHEQRAAKSVITKMEFVCDLALEGRAMENRPKRINFREILVHQDGKQLGIGERVLWGFFANRRKEPLS